MKLTLARPQHAHLISDFYRSVHDTTFPHKEMFDSPTVQQLLQDRELMVILATTNKKIAGAGMGFPRDWNESLEIGALSVGNVQDRGVIGKALFESLRRLGLHEFGLSFFRARTENSYRRGRKIGAQCWGYWPDPGSRTLDEAELIMGFFQEDSDTRRVRPPENLITTLPFAERILRKLTVVEDDIPYPNSFPVGAPRGTGVPVVSGRVWPTYHKRSNHLTIESSAGPYPMEILRAFVGKIREKGVSDIRLALPVNQEEAFLELLDFGFKPTSYLPGWYLRGIHRFDCVEMMAGIPRIRPPMETFAGQAVMRIQDNLEVPREHLRGSRL